MDLGSYGWVVAAVVVGGLWLAEAAWACPTCKESLFDPSDLPRTLSVAKGYALSIATLLAVPFVLVGAITTVVVRAARHAGRRAGRA